MLPHEHTGFLPSVSPGFSTRMEQRHAALVQCHRSPVFINMTRYLPSQDWPRKSTKAVLAGGLRYAAGTVHKSKHKSKRNLNLNPEIRRKNGTHKEPIPLSFNAIHCGNPTSPRLNFVPCKHRTTCHSERSRPICSCIREANVDLRSEESLCNFGIQAKSRQDFHPSSEAPIRMGWTRAGQDFVTKLLPGMKGKIRRS